MASNPGHEKSGKKKGHPISLLFSFLCKCGDCAIPIIGEKLAEKQVTGSNSIITPIFNRLRRSTFYPQPSLSYCRKAKEHYSNEDTALSVLGIPIVLEHLIEQDLHQVMQLLSSRSSASRATA